MSIPSSLVVAALSAAALVTSAHGAITLSSLNNLVTLNFSTPPSTGSPLSFSTASILGNADTFASEADIFGTLEGLTNLPSTATALATVSDFNTVGDFASYNQADGSIYLRPAGNGNGNTGAAASVLIATLQNNTGSDITSLQLGYEITKVTTGAAETAGGLYVYYKIGEGDTWHRFGSPNTLSGEVTSSPETRSGTLTSTWGSGNNLYIAWVDENTRGADDTYKIDNLTLNPTEGTTPVPEPSVALLGGLGALALLRRRRN